MACMPLSAVVKLSLLLFGKVLGGSFPYPKPFDLQNWNCDTCSGPGAQQCNSSDCSEHCYGPAKQCFHANRYKLGCCCDPSTVPAPDTYNCRVGAKHNGSCKWECCQAVRYAEHTVSSTLCGDGCCKPSNHGGQMQCGISWPMPVPGKKGLKRRPCCLEKGASQDHQFGARCCLHGDGVDCTSPGQSSPCCRLQSTTTVQNTSRSADPHAFCQRRKSSCAAFIPCGGIGVGVTCGANGVKFQSASQQKVCCLAESRPSARDPCQINSNDCNQRYEPCHADDDIGVDCASLSGKSKCCLPSKKEVGSCRKDCHGWNQEQTNRLVLRICTCVVALAILTAIGWLLYKKLRLCWQHLLSRVGRARENLNLWLLAGEQLSHLEPLVDHERRVLLTIYCQYAHSDHHKKLETPQADSEMLASECQELGYKVIKVHGATRADFQQGFREALQAVAGTSGALLLIAFSGHGVEVDRRMMWAPEDVEPNNLSTYFDVADECHHLMQVHLDGGMSYFGNGLQPATGLYQVILADCCRVSVPLDTSHFLPSESKIRRRAKKPKMYIIYSCGPGKEAIDASSSSLSPFMQQVKENLRISIPQSVISFSDSLNRGLQRETGSTQEVWHTGASGSFQGISLTPPLTRLRSGSGSSIESNQP